MAWVAAGLAVFAWLARRMGLSTSATVFGVFVLALHPIAAAGYYSFDCYSQVAADTIVWALSALLISAGLGSGPRAAVAGAVMIYVPALLFKEQALAAALNAVVIAAWYRNRRLVTAAAVMIAMSAGFAWMRAREGLWFDAEGPFALCLSCVPANAATLIGGSLLPVPTSEVYLALRGREWRNPWLAGGGVAFLLCLAFLGVGVAKSRGQPARAGLVMTLLIGATFPVVLLADIGELYSHALLFWVALLAAIAWHALSPRRSVGATAVAMLAAGLLFNLSEMRATGRRAAAFLASARTALAPLPDHARVVLEGFDDVAAPRDYSLLRISTPGRLLLYGVALEVAIDKPISIINSSDEAEPMSDRRGAVAVLRCGTSSRGLCELQRLTVR
jgi:hypothetical protein